MKNISLLLLAFLASFAILTACSSGTQATQINPTEGAQMFAGTYITTINADDVRKMESLDPDLAINQGAWEITFTEDGRFDAQKDGAFMASGLFTVKNNEIEIYVKQVCEECGCRESIGRFNWVQQDDRLAFSHLAGVCDTMKLVLTSRAITRQP